MVSVATRTSQILPGKWVMDVAFKMINNTCAFILLTIFATTLFGQEDEAKQSRESHTQVDHHKEEIRHFYEHHKLTAMMGYAFINNSFSDQSNDVLIVPAFGLNYDYIFKCGWGLGLHSDILLQQFKAETHGNEEEVIRENPIAVLGLLHYKPHHRWTLSTGYGVEFEKSENLQLIRIGVEYGIELPKNWELGFALEFDFKPDAYNSLLFGVGFSKLFNRKSK